jgi:deazaflavin-dependent oxidoreductase (nitroreductase family)
VSVEPKRPPPRWVVRTFWAAHRSVYSLSGGRFGLRRAAPDKWGVLRLRTIGRRSGEERKAVLGYFDDEANIILMAMNGWAEATPAWWLNLQAQPDASVDLAGESRDVRARMATEDERPRLWAKWVELGDDLDAFAAATPHETPVVILEPRPASPRGS